MKDTPNPLIALVDDNDQITGYADKLKVHQQGILHRAFSVFIFNRKGNMLLQQRAFDKYHSPGLWTNACCSHLLEGMDMESCVHDRLAFEMGFDTPVEFQFSFRYKSPFENGLTEHEIDHVYFGIWEGIPPFNPDEVASTVWIDFSDVKKEVYQHPEKFTYWFKHILLKAEEQYTHYQKKLNF